MRFQFSRFQFANGAAFAVLVVLALACQASITHAVSTGIIGNSGKQGANCDDCHSGGTVPLVRLDGPRQVYAEALATFRFVVQTQSMRQQFAGFNIAASDGQLEPLRGEEARLENGELTHAVPKPAVADETAWVFTWRAPPDAGSQAIYAAGMSANGTGTRSGDEMALLQTALTVIDGPRPGDANCDGSLSAADVASVVSAAFENPTAGCDLADANCNGVVNGADIDVAIAALFDTSVATDCEFANGSEP